MRNETDDAADAKAALLRIRRFRQDDQLPLAYRTTALNPYRDRGDMIAIYADDQGYEYWIDAQDSSIVQVGPSAHLHPQARAAVQGTRLAVAALRRLAVEIATREIPDFPKRRPSYHPLEDHKDRQIYFFRWDDFSQPVRETELPPFLQVGLYADGTLASYTNSLPRG